MSCVRHSECHEPIFSVPAPGATSAWITYLHTRALAPGQTETPDGVHVLRPLNPRISVMQ